jgi:hypothetical protein
MRLFYELIDVVIVISSFFDGSVFWGPQFFPGGEEKIRAPWPVSQGAFAQKHPSSGVLRKALPIYMITRGVSSN